MRITKIPKRNGKFRTIYAPHTGEKIKLRRLVPYLTKLAYHHCPSCVHGFMPNRSPVTNAIPHIGFKFTLCFDLADWFDSVTPWHVERLLVWDIIQQVFIDGAPRQGLPTSPAVANLAAADMDARILADLPEGAVYTRYADDISVSFNKYDYREFICATVMLQAGMSRFTLNESKTRLLRATAGRRIITGVAVDDKHCYPTRAVRRKLRAASHQGDVRSARGITEWCRLRLPKSAEQLTRSFAPKRTPLNRAINLFE